MGWLPNSKLELCPSTYYTLSMSTQPVPIKNSALAVGDTDSVSGSFTPSVGTPSLHARRLQYVGTPPVRNVPPRVSTPTVDGPSSYRAQIVTNGTKPSNPTSGTATPAVVDLDVLSDEEKARVLARHLVLNEERQAPLSTHADLDVPQAGVSSKPASLGQDSSHEREESEPFPIPYHAPGADITCVENPRS